MLRIINLAGLMIINEEDDVLIPRKEATTLHVDFALGKIWGDVSRYAATLLIAAFSPDH